MGLLNKNKKTKTEEEYLKELKQETSKIEKEIEEAKEIGKIEEPIMDENEVEEPIDRQPNTLDEIFFGLDQRIAKLEALEFRRMRL